MPNMQHTPNFSQMTMSQKIAYFKEKQRELLYLEKTWKDKTALNQAEVQMAFGFTPNKPISPVDLVSLFNDLLVENNIKKDVEVE